MFADRVKELRRVRAGDLVPNPENWRTHPEEQRKAMTAVLEQVGIAGAVLAREENGRLHLVDGHLRADLNPEQELPVLVLDVTAEEAKVLLATYDPISAMAKADATKLDALLSQLTLENAAIYDMLAAVSKTAGAMFASANQDVNEDEVPLPPDDPVTQPGDLWVLGDHRLLCGDSTKAEHVERLMAGAKADLCFTSPPYAQQRDYGAAKEHVQDWDALMQGVFGNLPMTDDGQVLVNLGLIHRDGEWIPYWDGWIEWMRSQGWRRFGWYVWDQGAGLPGDWNGRLGPSFEFVWHFNKTSQRPNKWVETSDACRSRKGGKNIPIGFRKEGGSKLATSPDKLGQDFKIADSVIRVARSPVDGRCHPASFPVALPVEILRSWDGLAYDPFLGSGTTLIAAEQLGRKCYGMEIDPLYCDVIVRRWEKFTGRTADRVANEKTPAAV